VFGERQREGLFERRGSFIECLDNSDRFERQLVTAATNLRRAAANSRGGTSERDRDDERDPREVFTRKLDLPRGRERRPVRDRDRVYEINGTESLTFKL